ncbi:MAG: hypothetical protein ACOCY1_03435 [Halovenus sp.]
MSDHPPVPDGVPAVRWWEDLGWTEDDSDADHPNQRWVVDEPLRLTHRQVALLSNSVYEAVDFATSIHMALSHGITALRLGAPAILDLSVPDGGESDLPPPNALWSDEVLDRAREDGQLRTMLRMTFFGCCKLAIVRPDSLSWQRAASTAVNTALHERTRDRATIVVDGDEYHV